MNWSVSGSTRLTSRFMSKKTSRKKSSARVGEHKGQQEKVVDIQEAAVDAGDAANAGDAADAVDEKEAEVEVLDAGDESVEAEEDGVETPDGDEDAPSGSRVVADSKDGEEHDAAYPMKVLEAAGVDLDESLSPRLISIIESLLFVSDKPLALSTLSRVLGGESNSKIRKSLEALRRIRENSGINLVEVAGGWQLRTHPSNAEWIKALNPEKPVRLSRAALESLAIVAYRQPVTRADVDEIRGVDSGGVLRVLLERNLLKILGKKQEPGRPLLYGTSKEFLSFFGLKDLSDLPSLREFRELAEEHREREKEEQGDGEESALTEELLAEGLKEKGGEDNLLSMLGGAEKVQRPDEEPEQDRELDKVFDQVKEATKKARTVQKELTKAGVFHDEELADDVDEQGSPGN